MIRKETKIGWTVALLVALGSGLLATRVRVNLRSDSAPRGIYFVTSRPHARGERVLVCLPETLSRLGRARGYLDAGGCPGRSRPVGKRLVALPGDLVEVGSEGLSVNGAATPEVRRLVRDELCSKVVYGDK